MTRSSIFRLFFPIFSVIFLCGCMHYSTGTGSRLPFTSIYIEPIKNDALVHHIRATLDAQIRKKIATHPKVLLSNAIDRADVCLAVKISDFQQYVATTMPDDTIRARSFTLEITAKCSLYDRKTQTYLFKDHVVTASIDVQAVGDYQWNKTKSLPQLSDKLAEKIYDVVCKPW